jgi:hypothetical protein
VGANRQKVLLQAGLGQRLQRVDHHVGHTPHTQRTVQALLLLQRSLERLHAGVCVGLALDEPGEDLLVFKSVRAQRLLGAGGGFSNQVAPPGLLTPEHRAPDAPRIGHGLFQRAKNRLCVDVLALLRFGQVKKMAQFQELSVN